MDFFLNAHQDEFERNKEYFSGQLSEFVYYSKYSRWDEEKGRRETWEETVQRAVDYLRELSQNKLDEKDYREVKRQLSAEALAAMSALEEEGSRDTLETEIAEMRQGLRAGLVCETCGFRNPGGSRFCGACGTALEPSPTPAESA